MKKSTLTRIHFGIQNIFIIIILISLTSCGSGSKESSEVSNEVSYDTTATIKNSPIKLDDYSVILAVDENIKMNEKAEMRVWIGVTGVNVSFSQGMVKDTTTIPATIGQYAKITPYAPDFEVAPSEMKCVKIDPSGSDARFTLIPKKSGVLKVSANIELYNCANCTGAAVPKTAEILFVIVKVDKIQFIVDKLKEMGAVVWKNLISFWSALIALIFAFLLFIIRRKLKRRTGFDG